MYYRLSDNWAFRGWHDRPRGISAIKGPNRMRPPFFFTEEVYRTLLKCDGTSALNRDTFDGKTREKFDFLLDLGVIESSEEMLAPLEEDQHLKMYDACFVEVAEWAITGRCNLRCEHCLVSAPDFKEGDPSREDCLRIINELSKCGIKHLELTGGEPFLRPDWGDLVKAITEAGISISDVFTNGLLISEEVLAVFKENRQRPRFQISYDGYGCHDAFRGVEGAEAKAEAAMRLLVENRFTVNASMCLTKDNKDSLRETVLRLAELGVSELSVALPLPLGRWATHNDNTLSFEEEWKVYEEYIPKYFEDNAPINISLGGYFKGTAGKKDFTIPYKRRPLPDTAYDKCRYCVEGATRIFIDPAGRVSPCMGFSGSSLKDRFSSVLEHSLGDILLNSYYRTVVSTKLSDLRRASKECRDCEHFPMCRGGCMLSGITPEGDYLVPDPGICYFFKNGLIQNLSNISHNC